MAFVSGVLGYVFWHRPRSRKPPGDYERKLLSFQETLMEHRPEGLQDALSFKIQGWPWIAGSSISAFEDWYLVSDFRGLGALNDGAVTDPNKTPHDSIAKESDAAAGALYELLRSGLDLRDARFATWIRKPLGMSYDSFFQEIEGLVPDAETNLWRRQMVLGPTPEFCLHSKGRVRLPARFQSKTRPILLLRSAEQDARSRQRTRE